VEPPVLDEGFTSVDELAFTRCRTGGFEAQAVVLEFDDVLCTSASDAAVALDPRTS
jgi:hypothetical protein